MSEPNNSTTINMSRVLKNASEINAKGETLSLQPLEGAPLQFTAPAQWRVSISQLADNEYWLAGRIAGTVQNECARCLAPVQTSLEARVEWLLQHNPRAQSDALVYGENEEELIVFAGPEFDLAPWLAEAFLEEMPQTVLHDPNCKGLCVACGTNLNQVAAGGECPEGRTDCPQHTHDKDSSNNSNPFAKLRELLDD